MCRYCTSNLKRRKPIQKDKTRYIRVMPSNNAIQTNIYWDNNDYGAQFYIKYCPMCGRQLVGKPRSFKLVRPVKYTDLAQGLIMCNIIVYAMVMYAILLTIFFGGK